MFWPNDDEGFFPFFLRLPPSSLLLPSFNPLLLLFAENLPFRLQRDTHPQLRFPIRRRRRLREQKQEAFFVSPISSD